MGGIKKVVLYKHGAGYFERAEEVPPGETITLSFRNQDMDYVLKSLTVKSQSGNNVIQSISYDTHKPKHQTLQELALDLPAQGGITDLLSRLKGTRIKVTIGSREFTGLIVGLDSTSRHSTGEESQVFLGVLDDNGNLKRVNLTEVDKITLQDTRVQNDLFYYLENLSQAYRKDTKQITLHCNNRVQETITLKYLLKCPVWKATYRIILPDNSNRKPVIQGWAIVDNTQDEDWTDVQLSLVAGRPLSIESNLYQTTYTAQNDNRISRITKHSTGQEERVDLFPALDDSQPQARSTSQDNYEIADVTTEDIGELFEYTINTPVTVQRNRSALVPILSEEFDGGSILLYNSPSLEHPYSAINFLNTTQLTLESGPAAILEKGRYVGECSLPLVKPGERRYLPYMVDLSVKVTFEPSKGKQRLSYLRISGGKLETRRVLLRTTRLRFYSTAETPKECIVEYPITPNYQLVSPAEPYEKDHAHYRFLITIKPQSETVLTVQEQRTESNLVELLYTTAYLLTEFTENESIPQQYKQALTEIESLLASRHKLSSKLDDTESKLKDLFQEQQRIRENLQALGTTSAESSLRSRYISILNDQESQIARLRELKHKLSQEISKRDEEIDRSIAAIDFELLLSPPDDLQSKSEDKSQAVSEEPPSDNLAEQHPPFQETYKPEAAAAPDNQPEGRQSPSDENSKGLNQESPSPSEAVESTVSQEKEQTDSDNAAAQAEE